MSYKVLVIEDNAQNMYLISYLLRNEGCEVLETDTAFAGLDAAATGAPDFILLDIQLPDMDGYEVARRLKSQDATRDIPIIAVTSYAMAGDRESAIRAGCDGYIEKPINPDNFYQQVKRYISPPDNEGGIES